MPLFWYLHVDSVHQSMCRCICYTCKHVSFTKLILWFHLYSWISIFVDSMKFKVPRKRKFLVNDRITILVEIALQCIRICVST